MSDSPYAPNAHQQPPQPQGYPPGFAPQYSPGYAPQGQPGYPPQQHAPQPFAPMAAAFAPRHSLPGTAIAASVIWLIYGLLGLLGNLTTLAAGGRVQPSSIIGLSLAVMFLVWGIQTMTGKLRSLLGPAITGIVLGGLTVLAFVFLGILAHGFHLPMWLFAIGAIVGGLQIVAGILGCVGNRAYKEYRATRGLY